MNAPSDMEKRWSALEHKYSMRCLWQQVMGRMIVECLFVPSAGVSIIVCKHYDANIKGRRNKEWPNMVAHYAYFPAGGVTWEEMDQALESIKKQQDAA